MIGLRNSKVADLKKLNIVPERISKNCAGVLPSSKLLNSVIESTGVQVVFRKSTISADDFDFDADG